MQNNIFIVAFWVGILTISMPAEAQLVTFIHGAPAPGKDWRSNTPVDIAIDGNCAYTQKTFGTKIGPANSDGGVHLIEVFEFKPLKPCRGKFLAAVAYELNDQQEVDLVFHYQDDPTQPYWFTLFRNTPALDAIEGTDNTAIEVRHVAVAPQISVNIDLPRGDTNSSTVPILGVYGPVQSTTGIHTIAVDADSLAVDDVKGNLKQGRAYWAYVTGVASAGTLELLVIESVPDELEDPPGDPGDTGGTTFSGCCIVGFCTQLSVANCQQSNGYSIGDVACSPDPCG